MLRVELKTEFADQIELGFEEIDVVLLVCHQLLEQVPRDIILHAVTICGGFLVKLSGGKLRRQIAIQNLLDGLADMQRIQQLQIGKALEKNDAYDELVGVL